MRSAASSPESRAAMSGAAIGRPHCPPPAPPQSARQHAGAPSAAAVSTPCARHALHAACPQRDSVIVPGAPSKTGVVKHMGQMPPAAATASVSPTPPARLAASSLSSASAARKRARAAADPSARSKRADLSAVQPSVPAGRVKLASPAASASCARPRTSRRSEGGAAPRAMSGSSSELTGKENLKLRSAVAATPPAPPAAARSS